MDICRHVGSVPLSCICLDKLLILDFTFVRVTMKNKQSYLAECLVHGRQRISHAFFFFPLTECTFFPSLRDPKKDEVCLPHWKKVLKLIAWYGLVTYAFLNILHLALSVVNHNIKVYNNKSVKSFRSLLSVWNKHSSPLSQCFLSKTLEEHCSNWFWCASE
jgi:hypothetical protein